MGWCASLLSSLDEWIVSFHNGTRRIQQVFRTHDPAALKRSPPPPNPRDIVYSRWLIRHYSVLEMCTTNYQMKTKHDHNPTNSKQCRDWKRQWNELFCFPFTARILDEVRSMCWRSLLSGVDPGVGHGSSGWLQVQCPREMRCHLWLQRLPSHKTNTNFFYHAEYTIYGLVIWTVDSLHRIFVYFYVVFVY